MSWDRISGNWTQWKGRVRERWGRLTLDQLEVELKRVELINAMIERGFEVYGRDYLERINVAVREQRGVGFRKVRTCVIRPSQDIGKLAAECRRESGGGSAGVAHVLMAKLATRTPSWLAR